MTVFTMINAINPRFTLIFERMIYDFAGSLTDTYNGGKWKSEELGDGMAFAIMPGKGNVTLSSSSNFSCETVDRRSAGATITLLALNHMLWKLYAMNIPDDEQEKLNTLFYALKDAIFSKSDLDRGAIYNLID